MNYETLKVEIKNKVAHVVINRPQKANSINLAAWKELKECFETLSEMSECRVVVLSGEGKHFCAGIDLSVLGSTEEMTKDDCGGRSSEKLRKFVKMLQAPIDAIERCAKPVLAAIHGGCIGAGLDIVTGCDMRYCTEDAYFTIKEIDMGMVADLGSLQRLPKLVGDGIMREMAYTGRNVRGAEAKEIGLVNRTYSDKDAMMEEVMKLASQIASKSPLSIRGTKEVILYTRDHSVEDGLNYIATWNAGMLLSQDLEKAFQAAMKKEQAEFKD